MFIILLSKQKVMKAMEAVIIIFWTVKLMLTKRISAARTKIRWVAILRKSKSSLWLLKKKVEA